ncbi:PAS domain-containing protein [Caballeronia sp. dw_19]|uniref:PAS domain-containing protein n=1 Tax=Caballeronia sp. dw_19 TaxID=2719791 RepID=UPI001BD45566|nr:PAS domain-containing protein [Caballeronia sp. dw_19]
MKTETHGEKNIHHRGAGNSSQPLLPYEALDYLPDLICVIGPDGFYEYFNKPWRQYASGNADQFVSPNWTECIYEADRCDVRREVADAMASATSFSIDLRLTNIEGGERWFLLRAHPQLDEWGQIRFWLYILTDIHERKLYKFNLAQKSKIQTDMLNVSLDCIKVITVDGKLQHMNKAGCIALNVQENSGFGMDWLNLLPEEVHEDGRTAFRYAGEGRPARFPGISRLSGEGVRYWDNMLTPLKNGSGEVDAILCVSRDVTTQKENQRRIELLLRELDHRSKNMLTVVQALIRRTVPDPRADFVKALDQRLCSISRSQDLLIEGQWVGITVQDLVWSQTAIAGGAQEKHMLLNGDPDLRLRPGAAEMIGLAMHELTTNAIKYGALSNDCGTVTITWEVEERPDGRFFRLHWKESGGPEVTTTQRRGFGTTVIGRNPFARHGAKVTHAFDASGVSWEFAVPVAAILSDIEPE